MFAVKIKVLITGTVMSFQKEDQEFDFSYMFEYSQNEPVRGGLSSLSLVVSKVYIVMALPMLGTTEREVFLDINGVLFFLKES